MTISADVRTWFGPGFRAGAREYIRGKEHVLFLIGAAVIFVHLLTQAFVDPEPMSDASDNIITGVAGPALVAGVTLAYPRLATGLRSAAALVIGFFAVITGLIIHVPHVVAVETALSDVTAIAAVIAGVVLMGMGLWLAWKAMPHLVFKLAIIPAVPLAFVFVAFPLGLALFVLNTPRTPLGDETPADYGLRYESVAFDNADGDTLKGWYVPSENGAAVILLHGAGKNRTKTLEYADVFAGHGYGVLMFDRRGYGESEGSPNVFGWTGPEDVDAAVHFLGGRSDVEPGRIGAMGLSVGGEIALGAIGTNDAIGAVVSEGAGLRVWTEYEQYQDKGFLDTIAGVPMYTTFQAMDLLSNDEQPPSNKDLIAGVAPRPILLISTGTSEEGQWNRLLKAEGGATVELWETGGSHIDSLSEDREEYEDRTVAFFDGALLGE